MKKEELIERYNEGERDFRGADLFGANLVGANLFRANLHRANLTRANLEGANLAVANLDWANLKGANLEGANLYVANLEGANLAWANLKGANLEGAYLKGANLKGANFEGANLEGVYLARANLLNTKLPVAEQVLLARWGDLSDELTTELMRYDAANHPKPELFDIWAKGGACPYNGIKATRAANFKERRDPWSPGPSLTAKELMIRVIKERCKKSDWH